MTTPPDPLDELLASWKETPAPAPDLRRRVWARIDAASPPRRPTFAELLRRAFAGLVRERAALAWVAACIALGLISAELRATRLPVHDLQQIATTYLQSINPLLRH